MFKWDFNQPLFCYVELVKPQTKELWAELINYIKEVTGGDVNKGEPFAGTVTKEYLIVWPDHEKDLKGFFDIHPEAELLLQFECEEDFDTYMIQKIFWEDHIKIRRLDKDDEEWWIEDNRKEFIVIVIESEGRQNDGLYVRAKLVKAKDPLDAISNFTEFEPEDIIEAKEEAGEDWLQNLIEKIYIESTIHVFTTDGECVY